MVLPSELAPIVGQLVAQGYYMQPVGSQTIEGAATEFSDYDFVVYDPNHKLDNRLSKAPLFTVGGSHREGGSFTSFKTSKEHFYKQLNLILVDSKENFNKWVTANALAVSMRATNKEDHIKIFDTVFGKESVEVLPF